MKAKNLFYLLVIVILLSACGQSKKFKTDVTTGKKPWTNLNFNNNPENFQFAIVSDRNGGNRPGVFEDAVNKLNLMQPEFVLSVGDLISGYTTDTAVISRQWAEVNETISGLKMPYFYLPGNHDITNKVMEKEWEKRYGKRYYSFTYKNTLFVILDSNDDDDYNLTQAQTDFALQAIQKNSSVRWTFVLMHHPIWTYDTHGRFQEIEKALNGRKNTVIAGHEHHYHQAEHNGSNYYILSTTGAGSASRGNYFGEFDHISWITMADNGPVMANLRLDGILPHDIANDKTAELAKPLIKNSGLNNILLCNKGEKFTNGTLYLSFENPTKSKLNITINFFHHHQLQIKNSAIQLSAEPGSTRVIEVPMASSKPLDYATIDLLLFDWQLKYDNPEYKEFALSGKYQIEVKPTRTSFVERETDIFTETTTVPFNNPFSNLKIRYSNNNSGDQPYLDPIEINQTAKLSFYLVNEKNECSSPENRTIEKTTFSQATDLDNPKEGLEYSYFEGSWTEIPDFTKLEAITKGVSTDFQVSDIAKRPDNWGLVYTGYIRAEQDNFFLFRVRADDACRLFVDNQLVVSDKNLKKGEGTGAIALKKGFHAVRMEFIEKEGDARLRVYSKVQDTGDWKLNDNKMYYH